MKASKCLLRAQVVFHICIHKYVGTGLDSGPYLLQRNLQIMDKLVH